MTCSTCAEYDRLIDLVRKAEGGMSLSSEDLRDLREQLEADKQSHVDAAAERSLV